MESESHSFWFIDVVDVVLVVVVVVVVIVAVVVVVVVLVAVVNGAVEVVVYCNSSPSV